MPEIITTIAELRARVADARRLAGQDGPADAPTGRVVLVPTMGALHEGHLRLVSQARDLGGVVVVSIFVNPLQFGPGEDLDRYPRTLEADVVALEGLADIVFAPTAAEMYPHGPSETRVTAGDSGALFEGASRPGHFDGVLTVVSKLFNIVQPDVAVFGQKDAQQVHVIGRMVDDLNLPVTIAVVDTVRETDGLALSSRNRYLADDDRLAAVTLSQALSAGAASAEDGVDAAVAAARARIEAEPAVKLDYLAIVDPETFREASPDHHGPALMLIAARVGTTRLIDNQRLNVTRENRPPSSKENTAMTDAQTTAAPGADQLGEGRLGEGEITEDEISEQKAVRLGKRERLLAEADGPGGGAYPVDVPVTTTIPAVRAKWEQLQADERSGEVVGIAGRVVHLRNTGKLCFAVLQAGDGSRIQVMVSLGEVGEESLAAWKELVDLGDHVFVSGEVVSSRRGELSVMAQEWRIAAKALLPLPNLHSELSEETRVRARYLDLIARDQARKTVIDRAKAVASLRRTFTERDFLEVETPMLQVIHGGASARPFVTRSNAFDTELYLRIAPELYLKRAVVGGIDRVFEINRNFRNEGADSTHSPEFAMLEAYQAYGDYNSIADLTQKLIQDAATAVSGSHVVTWADGTEYDLGGEWDRIRMFDSLSDTIGEDITPETPIERLRELAALAGIEIEHPLPGKYVEELWEHYVKTDLVRPTFVMDFPVDTSPLVRAHRSREGVVEKWDLYTRGFELATGYSELVDPVVQRERFVEQAKLAAAGDNEAMRLDEEFLRALEFGMPPTGGMGMGIDRLLMALTGLGIRETILFPLVK